jgi:ABC-type multidrug transport system ATPase subunit
MALLEITGLRRSFYGVAALNGVDLSLAPRSITGLIGPNGAGKTTLFNCVSGLIPRMPEPSDSMESISRAGGPIASPAAGLSAPSRSRAAFLACR